MYLCIYVFIYVRMVARHKLKRTESSNLDDNGDMRAINGSMRDVNGSMRDVNGSSRSLAAVGVRYQGEVSKRGQLNPAFKRRYFVLPGDGTLKYYKSKKAFDMDTKAYAGLIACKGLVSHEPRADSVLSTSEFPFTLTDATGKQIECACDTLQERSAWRKAILQASREHLGQDLGQDPPVPPAAATNPLIGPLSGPKPYPKS